MRRRRHSLVLLASVMVGVGVSLLGLWWVLPGERRAGETRSGERAPDALPPGPVFAAGGVPDHPPAARPLFAQVLPNYLIALDRWTRNGDPERAAFDAADRELVAAIARSGLPEHVTATLAPLAAAARATTRADSENIERASVALEDAARAANDALASADLGYFVDPMVLHGDGRHFVVMFSFRVERVEVHRVGDTELRALHVRRLDPLNWRYRLLGYASPQRRDAVVLLDRVDEQLVSLLAALGHDSDAFDPFALQDVGRGAAWRRSAETRAREVVTAELGAGGDGDDARQLGEILGRRQDLYAAWNRRLEAWGAALAPTGAGPLPREARDQLGATATAEELAQLDEIEASLAADSVRSAYRRRQGWLARSIADHELQHRLDMSGGAPLPQPPALARWVGPVDEDDDGADLATVAQAELSAYLAQVAREPRLAHTSLTLVYRYLLDDRTWGSGESYAALVLVSELAAELGIAHAPLAADTAIDRAAAAALYDRLATIPASELSAAATATWQRLFGRPLAVPAPVSR